MMFAIVIERDPLRWQEIPGYLENWLQIVGTLSAVALAGWLIVRAARSRGRVTHSAGQMAVLRFALIGAIAGYGGWAVLRAPELIAVVSAWLGGEQYQAAPLGPPQWQRYCLDIGSAFALLAVV